MPFRGEIASPLPPMPLNGVPLAQLEMAVGLGEAISPGKAFSGARGKPVRHSS